MTDLDEAWLTGGDADAVLAEAAARAGRASSFDELALLTWLRKNLPVKRARLVVEQVALRRRASEKFSFADRLFFTAVGLEQATDASLARYKAERFPVDARLADFCCGIGGDLLALARRGPTTGVDRAPNVVARASANCRVLRSLVGERFQGQVERAEVDVARAADCDAWHLDPDRRPAGRRTTQIVLHEPGPTLIEAMLAANPSGAIKLAPAAELPPAWLDRAECEWISRDGECRQLVAWFGRLTVRPGSRRATIVTRGVGGEVASHTFVGDASRSAPAVERFGRFLLEPDAAASAAGLVGALAEQYQIAAVHPASSYLTTDSPPATPFLTAFEIREEMPFDMRRLRAYAAAHDWGSLEIKKRGVDVDVEQLRREVRPRGSTAATLILVRRGDRVTAVVAQRRSNGECETGNGG